MSRARSLLAFHAVRTEGGLLPQDMLQRIALEDRALPGLTPDAYNLSPGERLRDAVNRAWSRLTVAWRAFQAELARLKEGDRATAVTRKRWLLPLFKELGFGQLNEAPAVEIEGKRFAISHTRDSSPIHLVGCRVDLDTRDELTGGSPHGLVQDLLNRSDAHLWGFVSNGYILRILRDHHSLTQQAYVEFDVQAIMEGEAFSEFLLLWLLCHQSRVGSAKPEECWLEEWFGISRDEGVRALEQLRAGVEEAIAALGTGFLKQKQANKALYQKLESGDLDKQDYYRQLLRLAYRLIFLFVAEDRGALLDPGAPEAARARYEAFYTTKRLRDLADRRRGGPHGDLWRQLRLVMNKLENGSPELGLPALGSFLWSERAMRDLSGLELSNEDLLGALRALCYTEQGKARYPVSFCNMGAEELGSVYESLLELHPNIHKEAGRLDLDTAAGHERKTTGSYYTPAALVDCLLDAALDPVLDEAAKKADPEKAILDLKVCDPACGSGHFLVAAARRMAMRLARVRAGEEEPSPPEVRRALRDVVGRCIYGVDLNPMAVELCKVSLWMEAIEPGKPLSFLEGHILEGNALLGLGATPKLMVGGIPDEAFEPIEGDDKEVTRRLKKRNKKARETGQLGPGGSFARAAPESAYVRLTSAAAHVEADEDEDIAAVRKKEAGYEQLAASEEFREALFLANAWCAAFVWPKQKGALEDGAITQDLWLRIKEDHEAAPPVTKREVSKIARDYSLFHWHIAFSHVFPAGEEGGGFDVVLGNPPWERVKLQEQEFFASRHDAIASAPNAAARKELIAALPQSDPALWSEWSAASRQADGQSHLIRQSRRYPLCGKGDVNTYALFAEHNRSILSRTGRAGFIVPTGIATDDTTKEYFGDLISRRSLAAFYGFENEAKLFKGIDHRVNFCLLVLSSPPIQAPSFSAFAREPSVLRDPERVYQLTDEDIASLNPNTRTCPVFRTRRDADLNLALYRRAGVLFRDADPEGNPWGVRFMAMLHMANDSALFRTRAALASTGRRIVGSGFEGAGGVYVPLYEAKMVYNFNHRFGDFALLEPGEREHILPQVPDDKLARADYLLTPRYWVAESDVSTRIGPDWKARWLLGWRRVTDARSSVRTVVASLIPLGATGDSFFLAMPTASADLTAALYANLCSFILDYTARQKLSGVNLNYFIFKQLPILRPATFDGKAAWCQGALLRAWLLPRVLELSYTAWDLEPFARDCGHDGPPYRWDPGRRFLLRCELDAAFFHLYGVARDDVDYIMETFPIVRRKDIAAHSTYRTKDTIVDIYDRMQRAIDTGEPYKTLLDPPPADPRVAHPPRKP